MTELFLIAHCVRGEAAFDIAEKMDCPHCTDFDGPQTKECFDCEELGYWWIIPTSGHRAFPFGWQPLDTLDLAPGFAKPMPPGWPDHYKVNMVPKIDIKALFRSEPKQHIVRRL